MNLMQETGCESLIYYSSAQLSPVVDQVKAAVFVKIIPILSRQDYDRAEDRSSPFVRKVELI